ncbi:MAG: prepilin-type N-terminal cleavage/methylation domain-containing protein [Candidatus Saccharimonadales bacterium]
MYIPLPLKHPDQRGDTIVEVLIALAIISSVLAGAFFVTNRSAQNIRDTEEHTQALQLLQGQIEQIRTMASDPNATNGQFPPQLCFDDKGVIQSASSANDFTTCTDNLNGTSGVTYGFNTVKSNLPGNMRLFTSVVKWDGLHGQTNSETLLYKFEIAP